METLLQSRSLIQRAFWLIRLRWIAIIGLAMAVFFSNRFLNVHLPGKKLYILSAILFAYNFLLFDLVRYFTWKGRKPSHKTVSRIIVGQITADMFILSTILHFSGGIENPFFLFFVFHTILASVMLSTFQSYIMATVAMILFGGMVFMEYHGWINHYSLIGFSNHKLYQNGLFVLGTLFILAITLYLVVYMTSSICRQLRIQQNEIEQANELLNQKDKLKNEYVLRLTHDIKGHLAAIESCLEIVLSDRVGPIGDRATDLVERAHKRASKCMAFIRALLRLTRMKLSGELQREKFPLRNAIFNAISAVENKVNQKSIQLEHELDHNIDVIFGEPVLIEETISNILFNAARYTADNGKIKLIVKAQDTMVLIQVTDNGIGIPPGEENEIFEEFHRAQNAREVERDGTGLGLSIAKEVVERHGGKIWATNNEDSGSTFSILLPMEEEKIL